MIDQLKELMQNKLQEAMASNSLGENETAEAAREGASNMMESISGMGTNGISALTGLLGGNAGGDADGLVNSLKEKLTEVLQGKGMELSAAKQEAEQRVPEMLNSVKERFASTDEADSMFSLDQLTGLAGGGAADLLNKAKGLFGK